MDNSSNNKNLAKRNILGALIIVMSLIIIGISGSYAYFLSEVEEENGTNKGLTLTSGVLDLKFTTEEGNYINALKAGLLNTSDVITGSTEGAGGNVTTNDDDNAPHTEFTIGFNEAATVETAYFSLFLTDIKMTPNFVNRYVRWALCDENGLVLYQGNFAVAKKTSETKNTDNSYNYDNINIGPTYQTLTKGTDVNYKLYVWLENDPNANQANDCHDDYSNCVDLRSGILNFKVGFRAVTKKPADSGVGVG